MDRSAFGYARPRWARIGSAMMADVAFQPAPGPHTGAVAALVVLALAALTLVLATVR